jgi:hypothetical protein
MLAIGGIAFDAASPALRFYDGDELEMTDSALKQALIAEAAEPAWVPAPYIGPPSPGNVPWMSFRRRPEGVQRFEAQRAQRRSKAFNGEFDPARVPAERLREVLEAKLGPLQMLVIGEKRPLPQPEKESISRTTLWRRRRRTSQYNQ